MMAYIRKKILKGKTYYYIVETERNKEKVKQKVIRYIGTIEMLIKKLDLVDKIMKKN